MLVMGPKINVSFKIQPPLCAQVFRYANGGKKEWKNKNEKLEKLEKIFPITRNLRMCSEC